MSEKQVLTVGVQLVAAHVFTQNSVANRVAYSKIEAVKSLKDAVIRLLENPGSTRGVAAKERTSSLSSTSFRQKGKTATPSKSACRKVNVSFLLSTPGDAGRINPGAEFKAVSDAIQRSKNRHLFNLISYNSADLATLVKVINEDSADILHFSGHAGGKILNLDMSSPLESQSIYLGYDVFSRLLKTAAKKPKLLILAACSTTDGADCLMDVVENVITMSDSVSDTCCSLFSSQFYQSISSGASLINAFDQAKLSLIPYNLSDGHLPTLHSASTASAGGIKFVDA